MDPSLKLSPRIDPRNCLNRSIVEIVSLDHQRILPRGLFTIITSMADFTRFVTLIFLGGLAGPGWNKLYTFWFVWIRSSYWSILLKEGFFKDKVKDMDPNKEKDKYKYKDKVGDLKANEVQEEECSW